MFGWSTDETTPSPINETTQSNATVELETQTNETVAEILITVLNETLVNNITHAKVKVQKPSAGAILYQLFGTMFQTALNQTKEEPEDFPDFDYFDYNPSSTKTYAEPALTRREIVSWNYFYLFIAFWVKSLT